MILVVSKELHNHKDFKLFMQYVVTITKRSFTRIDPDFIYKELASRIAAYLHIMKEIDFKGYGLYTGLFKSISTDEENKELFINKKKIKFIDLVNIIKSRLSDIIDTSSDITNYLIRNNGRILLVDENNKIESLLTGINRNIILKIGLTDSNKEYCYDDLIKIRKANDYILINPSDPKCAEKLLMYFSLIREYKNGDVSQNKINNTSFDDDLIVSNADIQIDEDD